MRSQKRIGFLLVHQAKPGLYAYMLNWIFIILITVSVVTAAWTGRMPQVSEATLVSAKASGELALGLVGQMALWLGFFGILEKAGAIQAIAKALRPLMTRLFPDVPPDHPAMGAMILNIAANMLGLGNAATPFGIKAMQELNQLNKQSGVATNAMALFLAINTSGVTLLATEAVGIRVALGSLNPTGILLPSLIATGVSTCVAIVTAKLLQNSPGFSLKPLNQEEIVTPLPEAHPTLLKPQQPQKLGNTLLLLGLLFSVAMLMWLSIKRGPTHSFIDWTNQISDWLIPILIMLILLYGLQKKIKTYEVFVDSAKGGFSTVVNIIPYLVAMMVAVGMFRASGAMDAASHIVGPFLNALGFPVEALPMALIRPLSGSGAKAVMAEAMKTYGPDSFIGYLVSVINGSTETTFYVLAVYYGSIQIKVLRHTVWACLAADVAGVAAATVVTHVFFSVA